ncbi:MAG: LdpA C-terminal domain-containing domain [Thermosynechococcaceae cyanobacterium]
MSSSPLPLLSLRNGHWFKLICGASFQHLPAIRTLCLIYVLAGADCIDVAADPAVIHAAQSGIEAAYALRQSHRAIDPHSVWLMVSLNDGEDPHFRKATFDPAQCPSDCTQPCVTICPAQAIAFSDPLHAGVIADRCYGCGRCLPICPVQHIETRSHSASPTQIDSFVQAGLVHALELHTQVGHEVQFRQLWSKVQPMLPHLQVLAISCPDANGVLDYLTDLYAFMQPLPCPLIWQADGRPMSGDIGDGATRATINYGEKLLRSPLPGFVQLAGGTNAHTVPKLGERRLLPSHPTPPGSTLGIAGIAYGSYARSLLMDLQAQLEAQPQSSYRLEDYPDLLWEGVRRATALVSPLKIQAMVNIPESLPEYVQH